MEKESIDKTARVEKFLRDSQRENRREVILSILAILYVIATLCVFGLIPDVAPIDGRMQQLGAVPSQ